MGLGALAIIPARGGSKGLARKNVRLLCGKPLVAWMIDAALKAKRVGRVVVSTDDEEIARVSRSFGADVVRRPPEISGDLATSEEALLHALDQLNKRHGIMLFLQCTAPLVLPEDIDGTVEALEFNAADSALAASPWHRFSWRELNGEAVAVGHDKMNRPMRQQMDTHYLEAGSVYAMRIEGFLNARHRFFGKTALFPVDPDRNYEIDSETDFLICETLLRRRLQQEKAAVLPREVAAVVTDFDGVLTENRVQVDQHGVESVVCHRGDGWAFSQLKEMGVRVLVLTNEMNPVVKRRCEKLNVECISTDDKLPAFKEWLNTHSLAPESTLYIGNDVPDVPCMATAGCGVAPADAYPQATRAARIVLDTPGGKGCLRELVDLILHSKVSEGVAV